MKYYEGKWIVGVSGGVDSMALLDMARTKGMDIIVAHVNYHKRNSALRDEQCVQGYCQQFQLPFFKKDITTYTTSNFQDQARKLRYDFFRELAFLYQAKGVLVAHQQDDHFETFLLQKQRNNLPQTYGLKECSQYQSLLVVRPLLEQSKQDLIEYCKNLHISFCEDESNDSDVYERNKLRHHDARLKGACAKVKLQQEIAQKTNKIRYLREQSEQCMELFHYPLDLIALKNIECDVRHLALSNWIMDSCGYRCSLRFIKELSEKILNNKSYWFEIINDTYRLEYEYQTLRIRNHPSLGYSYEIQKPQELLTPYFSFQKQGRKIEGFCACESEFPLRIRNWKAGDKISLTYGTKKISRFFIDRKIPHMERELWPVVENNMGEIIFVCGIGCDNKHYSNTLSFFVVK